MSRFLKVDPEKNYGRGHQRWVRCRFCSTLNDIEKRSTGDGIGYIIQEAVDMNGVPYSSLIPLTPDSTDIGSSTLDTDISVPKLDAAGESTTVFYTPREQIATSGCWFCGSRNFM